MRGELKIIRTGLDFRAESGVAAQAGSKRQSLQAKHHIHLGAEFLQSHWEPSH